MTDETQTEEIQTESQTPPQAKATKSGGKKGAVKAKTKSKTTKAKSQQAQTGPAIELPFGEMNKAEQKIVKAVFTPKGDRKPWTIKDIMKATGLKSSPVRNAVRRPVRGGWLEHAVLKADDKTKARGVYRLTEKARKRGLKAAKGA